MDWLMLKYRINKQTNEPKQFKCDRKILSFFFPVLHSWMTETEKLGFIRTFGDNIYITPAPLRCVECGPVQIHSSASPN